MNKITEKILYLWFAFIVIEAPLRYFFYSLGLPSLVYFKDVLLIAVFLYFVLQTSATGRISKMMLTLLALMLYGLIVGLINGLSFMQTAFGLKIFLTFFVGFMAIYILGVERKDAYGVTIPGSIEWWTLGLPRLSGFGRVSYETAILLFCMAALYLTVTLYGGERNRGKWKIYDRLFLLLSFVGIVLTTAKSSILAFLILMLFYLFLKKAVGSGDKFNRTAGMIIKALLVLIFIYGVVPPILAATAPKTITGWLNSDDLLMAAISASYVERMEMMWPDAYRLLSDGYMYFTGRGLGGIGASQRYFEPARYNAADNVYVYLLVNFGIVILLLMLGWIMYKIFKLNIGRRGNIYFLTFALILFSYGATLNVIESPTLTICLGFLLALWNRGGDSDS